MATKLWIDFETRSFCDLKETGIDVYGKHPSTEVLMMAWAFDNEPVALWLPCLGEEMPERLRRGISTGSVTKMAWNYNFERNIFKYRLMIDIPQDQWEDPNVICANMSLPIGLDRAAKALSIDIELTKTVQFAPEYTKKGTVKKTTTKPVKMFSEPTKATKTMVKKLKSILGENLNTPALKTAWADLYSSKGSSPVVIDEDVFYYKDWNSHPEKWQEFCDYCKQDVVAERAVWYAAKAMQCEITHGEIIAWLLDQRMNDTGVWIDRTFVEHAKNLALEEISGIIAEMQQITQLSYTKSGKNLSGLDEWLKDHGYKFDSLDKEHIAEALLYGKTHWGMSDDAYHVLELKKKLGGSAYTKLQTILDRVGTDGRLRNQFVYHGAHTGRWSGRGVQLQNLFKPTKDVSTLREQIVTGIRDNNLKLQDIFEAYNEEVTKWNALNPDKKPKEAMKRCPTLMDAVAGTIRASFAATPGNKLSVADLAQIESRVLAALAGCKTMINAYANGLDLYKDIMSFLLEKPYDQIDSKERANGKVIILGCGFGMGWEKFIEYAATFGVTLDETTAKKYVNAFREKYHEIPSFWKELDNAVIKAVKANICVYVRGLIVDGRNPQMLKIKLPSGRCIHYLEPFITTETTDWGKVREGVSYHAWDAKGMQIKRLYGGLLCENVVQAVARDVLLNGMLEAEKIGFSIIMTIHDEVVGESPKSSSLTYKDLEHAMTVTPDWAEGMGFILAAEGYDAEYYRK